MYLKSLRIQNYKCFADSGTVPLGKRTVVVGKNNAGKSAFLAAATLSRSGGEPHRTQSTMPRETSPVAGPFLVDAELADIGERDWTGLCERHGSVMVPLVGHQRNLDRAWEDTKLVISGLRIGVNSAKGARGADWGRSFGRFGTLQWDAQLGRPVVLSESTAPGENISLHLVERQESLTHRFVAERMNVGRCPNGAGRAPLRGDAANLPDFLRRASEHTPGRFNRYKRAVARVLPDVADVRPMGARGLSAETEIMVFGEGVDQDLPHLAVLLAESGTGVSQVLAILAAIMLSDEPRTILIDEPGSFLHPGAIAQLCEIMRAEDHHQYVVSTHSPGLIAMLEPDKVLLVQKRGGASTVSEVDATRVRHQRALMSEVGASFAEIFGRDGVLWVEGPSEQRVFELIARAAADLRAHLGSVAILSLVGTSVLDRKASDAARAVSIYEQLSKSVGGVAAFHGIIVDLEGRSESQVDALKREVEKKLGPEVAKRVVFLQRRMLENYLLDAEAIADVLRQECPDVTPEAVQAELDAQRGAQSLEDWLRECHGTEVLAATFTKLTASRSQYASRKAQYAPAIAAKIQESKPEQLEELRAHLRALLAPPS